MKAFATGPALVFAFNGSIIRGWPDLESQQLKWWNNGKSDVVHTMNGTPDIAVMGPGAAVVTMGREGAANAANGQPATGTAVVTMAWQKLPEGWRVVQAHESTIH